MTDNDIRWIKRFSNYNTAFTQLAKFVAKGESLSELEEQGLIKAFEYTYELAWNTMKDFYENQGETNIQGSKDAIRLAYKRELIEDGEGWMDMVGSRTKTAHTYNLSAAQEVKEAILYEYYPLFKTLKEKFLSFLTDAQKELFNKSV
jgi:nucleotidyltransferase substrate binding protein (TIGR01987 family)